MVLEIMYSTIIHGTLQTDACLGRVADNFTIYIYNIHGTGCTHSNLKGDAVHIGPRLEVTEIGFRDSTQVLPPDLHYNAVIEARNSIGSSNSTEIIQISECMYV